MNGDGFPGPAGAFDRYNDLVYVPEEATEVPAGFGTLQLLASALRTDPCLVKHKGEFMERNSCRAPWQNRLDLRVAHTLRVRGADNGARVPRLDADSGIDSPLRRLSR